MHSNMVSAGAYGVYGSGHGAGKTALAYYAPNALFTANAIIGGNCIQYPAGTSCPTMTTAGFVNAALGNYQLLLTSLFHLQGYDGRDVGADVSKVTSSTQNVIVAP